MTSYGKREMHKGKKSCCVIWISYSRGVIGYWRVVRLSMVRGVKSVVCGLNLLLALACWFCLGGLEHVWNG